MSKVKKTIKSSKHFVKESNEGKKKSLSVFLKEYRRVMGKMIDFVWNNGIEFEAGKRKKICLPSQGYYDVPKFFDYKKCEIETELSARALSSMTSQVCGIIGSAVRKQAKRIWTMEKLMSEKFRDEHKILRLKKNIEKNLPKKPSPKFINKIPIELSSKCAVLKEVDGEFNWFLRLQSLGKIYGKIWIPIRKHKHSLKLEKDKKGKLLGSFLISEEVINLRWEIEIPPIKPNGKTVGADSGKNTLITLSDGQQTMTCPHGHTMNSIMKKLSRAKKGSKGFKKTQALRTNHINWSIKQLNLKNIKQINLEQINNVFYKNKCSRLMSHWNNSEIQKALENYCEELGVQVNLQSSLYRSQRCSSCGLVRKSNRKGKNYNCSHCDLKIDADLNAAKNHELELFSLPQDLRHLNLNRQGFFWTSHGVFHLDGSELRVPDTSQENSYDFF